MTITTERRDAITVDLLNAAIEVFGERGLEGAPVAEIARRAQLTTGAIYSRWAGKQELMIDALDLVMSEHLTTILSGSADLPATDILASLGDHLVEPDSRAGHGLCLEAFAVARRDPDFAERMSSRLEDQASRLAQVVVDGQIAGLIDPELSVSAVVTLCNSIGFGFILMQAIGRPMPDPKSWNQLIARLIAAAAPPSESTLQTESTLHTKSTRSCTNVTDRP